MGRSAARDISLHPRIVASSEDHESQLLTDFAYTRCMVYSAAGVQTRDIQKLLAEGVHGGKRLS